MQLLSGHVQTSKSDPRPSIFSIFDFQMCFAPQRRALFRHLNFQTCADNEVLCTISLRNVLRATTACTFSTSQLPKVLRGWCVLTLCPSKFASRHNGVHCFHISTSKSVPNMWCFSILTSKCASRHICVQLLISHLPRCLRTRHLASLLFDPPEPQNIGKTLCLRHFYLFAHLHLLSSVFLISDLLSSDLLISDLLSDFLPVGALHILAFPSLHIVGSLTSKLPSVTD